MIKPLPARALRAFLMACATLAACNFAFAESDDAADEHVPPPRLAVVEGDVQFWRSGADAWEPAQLNAALTEGDSINVGGDGTVELQVGARDFVRLRANTRLTLVTHDPGLMHFRLDSGTASLDLRSGRSGQLVRIDTAGANIVMGGRGYYRIEARDDETRLAVRNNGRATLTFADGRSRSLGAGEEILVEGGGAAVSQHAAPARDSWDRWNDDRSDWYAASASNRYLPDDVYGAADLDRNGRWQEDRTYGSIWMPAVAAGWAPYSAGSWRWDPFYGWTWVDVAPWGWATSHYGRWVHVGGGWAWAPGPRHVRVAYAPALVSFSYFDGGMSWVALGWGEPLTPWWGRPGFRGSAWWGGWGGPRVIVRVGGPDYSNRSYHEAVISVRDTEFGHRPVRGTSLPIPPHAELRPVVGDHPIRFDHDREHRRDAMPPPRPGVAPIPREGRSGEPVPRQPREMPQMRPEPTVMPRSSRPEPPRIEQRREERREERRIEPAAPAVQVQPRVIAPLPEPQRQAAPVVQPQPRAVSPVPEIRREPAAPREMPRERRQEERVIQREAPRVETPRMEAPRPQFNAPSAPEARERRMPDRERDHGGHERGDRPHGPGDRN